MLAGCGTNFVLNGFHEWQRFLSTGKISRPVTFLAAPAAIDQALLVLICAWAYLRFQEHQKRDIIVFLAALVSSVGYFLIIISIFNPQYLPALKRAFGG